MIHLFWGNTGEYIHLGSLGVTWDDKKNSEGLITWVFWIVMRHSYLNVTFEDTYYPETVNLSVS